MTDTLEVEPTLTDRYQTIVPKAVLRAFRLRKRDKVHHTNRPSGDVVVTLAEGDDPALGAFLGFLTRDIAMQPERLQTIDTSFVQRLLSVTRGTEVDLDAPLSVDDK